jgi:hypothetical protein
MGIKNLEEDVNYWASVSKSNQLHDDIFQIFFLY